MKLSEAIIEGSKLKPQAFCADITGTRSCALQAAGEALGWDRKGSNFCTPWELLEDKYPYILDVVVNPVTGDAYSLENIIYRLNDTNRWTREDIAAWVATKEGELCPSL